MIAFDADDTLWHNERHYLDAQAKFAQLLSQYHPPEWIAERLYQTEMRNIQHYGYGVKAFALSMIETAVELTEGRVSGNDIRVLINIAKGMLSARVQLLNHVVDTIPMIAASYPLMIITKGDLLDQETKINRSGLSRFFQYVEIVSQKTVESYQNILETYSIRPERFIMVGNSLRSDILPVLELGGVAVYIPYESTWLHETAELPPREHPGFYNIQHLGQLPSLLDQLEQMRA